MIFWLDYIFPFNHNVRMLDVEPHFFDELYHLGFSLHFTTARQDSPHALGRTKKSHANFSYALRFWTFPKEHFKGLERGNSPYELSDMLDFVLIQFVSLY